MIKKPLILAFCILLSGCTGAAYELPQISEAELRTTQQKMAENREPLKIYERSDKVYRQKLASITNRLLKNAQPLCDYTGYTSCYFQPIYVSDDTPNAYASENYKITLHRGLLQHLKNDDEIAAVTAHEMGHHLAFHNKEMGENMAAGAAISGILTAVLIGAANANNPYYNSYQQQNDQQTLKNMMEAGSNIGRISYSKEQEREADLLGVYLLSRAGYNLEKGKNIMLVISKLPGESDRSKASMVDSHPASPERVVAWEKAIAEVKSNKAKLPYAKQKK